MKLPQEHLINSRTLTTFNSIETELKLNKEKNYLFDLSHLSVLDVNGEKAIEFLQGQLTCDVRLLSDIQMVPGAQCNLKGRILSLVDVINWQGIKLILPSDLLEPTQNSLSKTALLSRVSLDKNNKIKIFGFYLQNSQDILPDTTFFPTDLYAQACGLNFCYYHLGMGFYIFLVQQEFAGTFSKAFSASEQILGSLTWHTLRLINHQIEIYPESRGLFLPHRLGLHETPYISFDKGCYKGQEIIARTQYRATIKHELKIFNVTSNQRIYSGQRVLKSNEGSEIGELIDYSYLSNNRYLIALSLLKETVHNALFEGHSEPIELRE